MDPVFTAAVSVTTVPAVTEVTGAPVAVTVRAAVVVAGTVLTVTSRAVVAVSEPEVPVIVTVAVPRLAELFAVSVRMLVSAVGFVPHDAVTPPGRPDAARFTLPENPYSGVTKTVDLPESPWMMDSPLGKAESVKVGA